MCDKCHAEMIFNPDNRSFNYLNIFMCSDCGKILVAPDGVQGKTLVCDNRHTAVRYYVSYDHYIAKQNLALITQLKNELSHLQSLGLPSKEMELRIANVSKSTMVYIRRLPDSQPKFATGVTSGGWKRRFIPSKRIPWF